MDGLSTVVTIATVLDLSAKFLSTSYRYSKEVIGAKREIKVISDGISNLKDVLKSIERVGDSSSSSQRATLDLIRNPDGPLHQCDSFLRPLVSKLEKPLTSRRTMIWPLRKRDVDSTLEEIERLKTTLNLALSIIQMELQISSESRVVDISDDAERQKKEKLRNEIIAWLSTTRPSSNHNINRRKHQPGTGEWFINGSYFEEWRTTPNSFVWLHGSAGCGKSILSSTIIDHVEANHVTRTKSALVYYYFDFNDSMKQKVANFMSSILADLCAQADDLPDPVQQLYLKCNNGHREPLLSDLVPVFLAIVALFDTVYVVIDALDECPTKDDERQELLKTIEIIHSQSAMRLHLLVTSRRHYDIEAAVGHLTGIAAIQIESGMVDDDIKMYIRSGVQAIREKNTWWHDQLCLAVEENLSKGANGMFRWVYCQLDALKSCLRATAVEEKLKKLPKDLRTTYAQILADLPEDYLEDARIALRWLVFSEGPLLLRELVEALRVDPSRSPPVDADARLTNPNQIQEILPNLITISHSYPSLHGPPHGLKQSDSGYHSTLHVHEIKLAHFSVKEFLLSSMTEKGEAAPLLSSIKLNQCFMAEACLYYKLFYEESKHREHPEKDLLAFPLLAYACQYWPNHRAAFNAHEKTENQMEQPSGMEQILFRLCTRSTVLLDYRPHLHYEITKRHAWASHGDPGVFAPVTSLYFATYHGLHEIVRWLLDRGQNVREEGGFLGTPLHAACVRGNLETARLLLDNGANIDSRSSYYGQTALHLASQNGDMKTVELLLDYGASVDIEDASGSTSMINAASQGAFEMIGVLLDHGADIYRTDNLAGNALSIAVGGSNYLAAETLLDRGAQIHGPSETEDQVLLLGLCARDPLYEDYEERRKSFEIATLLLDRGADINRKNEFGSAALAEAAYKRNPALLRLFLDRGADVFARDKARQTALDTARYEQERTEKGSSSYQRGQESMLILEEAEKAWLEEHGTVIDQEVTQPSQPPL